MTGELLCLGCNESKDAIRASQRTDDPLYCFDGMAEYPTHRFTARVPTGAAMTGWKRRGVANAAQRMVDDARAAVGAAVERAGL